MSEKIKLLHIIGSLGVGGCEKQLLGLCQRMDRNLFDIGLIWYAATPDSMVEEFNRAGVKTFFIDKYALPKALFFQHMRNAIRHFGPDIVHAWLPSAGFWGRCAALACGIRKIVMSYRVEMRGGILETTPPARFAEKLLARKSLILANSRAIAQSLERYFGIPQSRVRIIYNAVEVPAVDSETARRDIRQELGLPAGQKIVLMVARQHKQKNYPLFIKTAAAVRGKRSDVTFVSVGRGDMMAELTGIAEALGVGDAVRFVGIRHDVYRWLAAADVFCFTSNYEGFPNAVLEAMVAGVPVATTAFPGVEEVVTDGETGCIVPLDDEAAMAQTVTRLLEDQMLSHRLTRAARDAAAKRYSWEALLSSMQEVYLPLAQGRHLTEDKGAVS